MAIFLVVSLLRSVSDVRRQYCICIYSMEQSLSYANRFSAIQKIPRILLTPVSSLPHSQVPTICPYPEPDQSSPCLPHPTSRRPIVMLSSHLRPAVPSGLFPSGFLNNTLPMRATCPVHLILLDLITQIIFGEQYRSLRTFLNSCIPS